MSSDRLPDYQSVDAVLEAVGARADAAEGHGALCGMLTLNLATDEAAWVREVLSADAAEATPEVMEDARQMLSHLFALTRLQLNDPAMAFELLLPGDDDSLRLRVDALGRWCQGYLYGLALGGISEDSRLPADSAEVLRDLVEIARAGFDLDEDEESERAYMEVLEYVRAGVLLLNEEMQPIKAPPRLQ
ncbi:MAG: UPF0149 family protein [Chromatiales bacterium]|jgi:uncharacterized protein YgfB (UPF0149 family)|nr:UPF0149 family protein [Chromatiales bacterium]MDX9766446.1 UPF0149 family protein [Ectothiorhodospiraceae bacterium]